MTAGLASIDLSTLIANGVAFGLSPEDFLTRSAATQRGRLLVASTLVVAERGYAKASVSDIVAAAGVSRSTFYDNFDGKDDCLIAAYQATVTTSLARMAERAMVAAADGWRAGLVAGVQLIFDDIRDRPMVAQATYVGLVAAGPGVLAARREGNARFAEHVHALAAAVRTVDPRMPDVSVPRLELLISGLDLRIAYALNVGNVDELDEIRDLTIEALDVMYSPALGPTD
ncbi:TetR/AcrR family transcriptional regulator [Nocardioides humilatus]|uniref:TetR/AcrR family transcriptional regulator n=1 Tax=Nocardioides humilatus TaxID=2607660 RepID=A0A5B1L4K1_9ACTN|nr:TetR/AcrR family transcriptional regulator [Nocardioides humilatus]KAA1415435.1 TetR/AcrR family transcriptional regulator [Nocardioides humilatus]